MATANDLARIVAILNRIERNTLLIQVQGIDTMTTLQELQDTITQLTAGQAEAKADAARHEQLSGQAVGLLQALSATIADLRAQQGPVTQAQLDALGAQAAQGLADMAEANAQRDAADATLAQGTTDNTPAP